MNSLKVMCCQERQATKMCMSQTCKECSLICPDEDCICNKKHQNCIGTALVSTVIARIYKKQSSFEPLQTIILRFYDSIIKYAMRQKEEYQTIVSNKQVLNIYEKKLLQYVQKSNSRSITPQLVFQAVKSLSKEPTLDMKQQLEKVTGQANSLSQLIITKLETFKRTWKVNKQNVVKQNIISKAVEQKIISESKSVNDIKNNFSKDFNFNIRPQLCHQNFSILNDQLRIKLAKMSTEYLIGLISPPIIEMHRIDIKIISKQSNFYIGICSQQSAKSSNFQRKNDTKAYMISSLGRVINYYFKEQNNTQIDFKFNYKDIIQIRFDIQNLQLKFYKQNKRDHTILSLSKEGINDMRFCVCMFGGQSQAQIIRK